MASASFEEHLRAPVRRGPAPDRSLIGSAGGSACGDLIRVALVVEDDRVVDATFEAEGCGALIASGSACMSLVVDRATVELAKIDANRLANELGGLLPSKHHAAVLVADALHRALSLHWRRCVDQRRKVKPVEGRVLVAMSGGVDSGVAALLAGRRYDDVVAVTLKLWADPHTDDEKSCCSPSAVLGARALAHSMRLAHLTLDMESDFRKTVVDDYISEHRDGRTPNPCVRCNGSVRFDAMLALADAVGAQRLITGHYARIGDDGQGALLEPAAYARKDQAYMLAAVEPAILERVEFPLAALTKPEVREIAREAGLAVAEKRESQDLCFLAGTDRRSFMSRHGDANDRPGEIVDLEGVVIGDHAGHANYTVGQRRGLGVASPDPLYVIATDPKRNQVVVGPREQLAMCEVELAPATLYRPAESVEQVRLRYQSEPVACRVLGSELDSGRGDGLWLELAQDAFGVAAGQVGCLYDRQGRVVGHGTIVSSRPRSGVMTLA